MENSVSSRIKNIMSIVLGISINKIDKNSSSMNISSWDSLKHMNLIISLEEEFEIEFEENDIPRMTKYKTIKNIILLLYNNNH